MPSTTSSSYEQQMPWAGLAQWQYRVVPFEETFHRSARLIDIRMSNAYSYNSIPSSTQQNGAFDMPATTTVEIGFLPDSVNIRSGYLPNISEDEANAALAAWDRVRPLTSRLEERYVLIGRVGVPSQRAPYGPLSFAYDDTSAQLAGFDDFEAWGEAMVTFRSTLLQPTFALDGKITAAVRRAVNAGLPKGFSVSFGQGKMRFVTTRKGTLAEKFVRQQTIQAKQRQGDAWRNRPFTKKEDGTFAPDQIIDMLRVSETFALDYKDYIQSARDRLRRAAVDKLSNQPRHIRNLPATKTGGERGFRDYLEARTSKLSDIGREIIDNLPAAGRGIISSRKWGIEVESPGARNLSAPAGWRSVSDGSLSSAYTDGYQSGDCQEFVSPILHSFHSRGLEFLTDEMENRPQNDSAGLHVHVEASDLSAPQLGAIVFGYQIIEPLVKAAYQRQTWQYCALRSPSDVLRMLKALSNNQGIDYGTRYTTLNLQSLEEHGTIEFRAMGPVYEYEYLIRWASFCREMVNTAKNGAKPKDYQAVHDEASLRALFIKFGNETVDNVLSIMDDSTLTSITNDNRNVSYELARATNGEV